MDKRFFDEVKVYMQAGNGGNGCCSFRRVKYIAKGGPDGGNGGNGGDVVLETRSNLNTLLFFHYNVHHQAGSGKSGAGQNKTGANGETKILGVPIGTQVWDENGEVLLADLDKNDTKFTIVKGGSGGVGNMAFKTSVNQTPRKATKGEAGECGWFKLRLKMLSDVGLVGLPNAGKSSLMSIITNAKVEIGDYPFTTLKPTLGVVKYGRGRFVLCDIPGLIADAHIGAGLGDKFLKHIERCSVLTHIVDVSVDNVVEDFKTIQNELLKYNKDILKKQIVVVFNKVDLVEKDVLMEKIDNFKRQTKIAPICISTKTHQGVRELIKVLFNIVKQSQKKTININLMSGVGKIGKLVRDKIPDVILKSGKKCNYSVLTDGEYLTALKRKVVEEATEVEGADCNTKIIEELGDLLDVVETIVMVCGLSMKDINSSRKTKNEKYGGFSGKIFLQEIYEEKDK